MIVMRKVQTIEAVIDVVKLGTSPETVLRMTEEIVEAGMVEEE